MQSHSETQKPASRATLVLAGTLVAFNQALVALGLRRKLDGWRRGASLSLTRETATFVLSAFQLDALSDLPPGTDAQSHLARKLAAFLAMDTEFHLAIRLDGGVARLLSTTGPCFTLALEPLPVGHARFIRPHNWSGQPSPATPAESIPIFQFVARPTPEGGIDLWLRIHHAATDGAPAQELLTRMEQTWGIKRDTIYPSAEEFLPFTAPRPTPGRPGMAEVQTFLDFSPLLIWRKKQNESLAEPMTISAAILWWLAQHPRFSGRRFGTTVEIPAIGSINRGVGVVAARPADYLPHADGLARFVADFNRELKRTRERRSKGCRLLDAAAHIPAPLEKALLACALLDGNAFGAVGLTILKNARVFGAPLGDAGHEDGFIAIGGLALPTGNGKQVGCIVIKGAVDRIAGHARILKEALQISPTHH